MKVCHTLICCFFLSLLDGNTVLIDAQNVFSGTKGENVTVQCSFTFPGTTKIFCKNKCEPGNILIETTEDTAQRGRYSIRYEENHLAFLNVTFTNLTKSDSGWYSCGLIRTQLVQFEIIVRDARLTGNHEDKLLKMRTGEDVTVQCVFTSLGTSKFFCKDSCQEKVLVGTAGDRAQIDRYSIRYLTGTRGGSFLFVTITNLTKSDSGQYWCALDSSSLRDFELIVTDASVPSTTTTTDQSDTTTEGVLLYVGLTLLVVFILSSLAVLIICIKRNPTLCGLRTRGNSDATNMEITPYENCPPVSTHEDSTYQSLSPASMDQDQTYSTLTHTNNTYETL